jgi:hypothetical protein
LYLGLAAAAIDAQEIALHGSILLNSVHDAVLFVIYGKVIGQTLSHAHAHALTAPHAPHARNIERVVAVDVQ